MSNKEILLQANEAFNQGDYETYLTYFTPDTKWVYVGERTILGKEQLRRYLPTAYDGATFTVEQYIEQGNYLTVVGKVRLKQQNGSLVDHAYCDIWQLRDGKVAELRAFVIAE
jgi:ketosteroid isomerase-like protein